MTTSDHSASPVPPRYGTARPPEPGPAFVLQGVTAPAIAGRLQRVRLQKTGFRSLELRLLTTLLDGQGYFVAALVDLMARGKVSAEVDLRHLKTMVQVDKLTIHLGRVCKLV